MFMERSYDAATLWHIARVAGVDAGTVRHYFVDKAGPFRAAIDPPIDPGAILSSLNTGG
jgi:AcrR family transcriptional regulator